LRVQNENDNRENTPWQRLAANRYSLMKSLRPALVAGSVAALFVAGNSGLAQARSNQRLSSELQSSLVRHLIGLTVENSDGERLGKIKNFALDMRSGEAKYAIISSGGTLGIGSQLKVVPAQAVSSATAKKGIVSLDISKSRWAKAPLFNKKSNLAALSDPAWVKRISHFYSQSTQARSMAPEPAKSSASLVSTNPETGERRPTTTSVGSMHLAGDLMGKEVVNRQQETLGNISDLLVDLQGQRPAFAIVSADRWMNKGQSFAVPLRALSAAVRGQFMLDANRKMFEEAQAFNEKVWLSASASNAGAIYRFATK
jgi:sporulation protein YlmC with PRC-barrel domain